MKHFLIIIIVGFLGVFFTSCQVNKTYVKKYYKKLNDQTVFVETTNIAKAAGCEQKNINFMSEEGMCGILLQNLPDIHGRYVGTGTFIIPDVVDRDDVIIRVEKSSSIIVRSQNFSSTAKIIKKDKDLDLCILEVEEEIKIKPAKIARKSPKRGSYIMYAGAPYGMISEDFLLTFDGTYSGDLASAMVFSLPCAQGASGSSIRNRKNEIISMVQRVHPEFSHICLGVSTEKLREFLSTKHPEK